LVLLAGWFALLALAGPPAPHCVEHAQRGTLADRLAYRWTGDPVRPRSWLWLAETGAPALGLRGVTAAEAIGHRLGLDARCVRVFVLDEDELMHRFHGTRGRIDWGAELGGFHYASLLSRSAVFVKRERGGVSYAVLVHESLHALSQRFSEQAGNRFSSLVEGLTQYFTRDVVIHELGIENDRWLDAYPQGAVLAERLALLVGRRTLESCFFHEGLTALEREVNAHLGRRGSLREAALALASGDLQEALDALE
jgi:hypothetical protein